MAIEVHKLSKDYVLGDVVVHALRGVDVTIEVGEFVAIMGPSGSGKSTFMNVVGCLDRPTSGEYVLNGEAVARMNDNQLADIRNRYIGFVFQNFNLLPRTSALKNVELPLMYAGMKNRREKAIAALDKVGLGQRMDHRPNELSGGQQQRVAIARSLCMNPKIMLFDEPTSALDPEMVKEVLDVMSELADEGITMICVTHEMGFARQVADTMVFMAEGSVIEVGPPSQFFENPQSERTRQFLGQILQH